LSDENPTLAELGVGGTVIFTTRELFQQINTRLEHLQTLFIDLQRRGSDTAQAAMRGEQDLRRRVETLEKESATEAAVRSNEERIEKQESTARHQWLVILLNVVIGLGTIIVMLVKK